MAEVPTRAPMRIAASCPTHTRTDVTAVRQGHKFVIDEPPIRGGADAGPTPLRGAGAEVREEWNVTYG